MTVKATLASFPLENTACSVCEHFSLMAFTLMLKSHLPRTQEGMNLQGLFDQDWLQLSLDLLWLSSLLKCFFRLSRVGTVKATSRVQSPLPVQTG